MTGPADVQLSEMAEALGAGDLERATACLRAAVTAAPADPRIAVRAAELACRIRRPRLAASWFRQAARLARSRGLHPWARLLLVRGATLHPLALADAVGGARQAWEAGSTLEAIDLLLWLSGPAGRSGARGMWAWLSVAGTVARAARSRALAVAVLATAARLVGREPLYFRLLGGQEAPGELPGGFGLLVDRFLTLDAGDEGLLALRTDLLDTVLLYDPDLLRPPQLAEGPQSADRRIPGFDRVHDCGRASPSPTLRSHRPRPWQIPASIEAQRLPVQPVLPRELFARLPEPMRRSVVWLEAQQRRAASERRRTAGGSPGA